MVSKVAQEVARRHLQILAQQGQEQGQSQQEQEAPEQQGEGAESQYGGKGEFALPEDHVAAMHSPAGFSCATCRFVDVESHACTEPNYIRWNGGDGALPDFPLEEICSDWWSPA